MTTENLVKLIKTNVELGLRLAEVLAEAERAYALLDSLIILGPPQVAEVKTVLWELIKPRSVEEPPPPTIEWDDHEGWSVLMVNGKGEANVDHSADGLWRWETCDNEGAKPTREEAKRACREAIRGHFAFLGKLLEQDW